MSNDIEDLIRLVEASPGNHKLRWRLARKLYSAWDYRTALEHLLILRETWSDRLSVTRYLAATYYRLGRYNDAIRELLDTLETFPEDGALLELLARVYEGAGNRKKALETWRRAAPLSNTGEAQAAVDRLEGTGQTMSIFEGTFDGGAVAPSKETLLVCKHCGTLNELYSPRCPRCHAAFDKEGMEPQPGPAAEAAPRSRAWAMLGLGIACAGGICIWGFLLLR
ncbi:MAG: hypothetical protein HYV27_06565 [Candidatus Hydrogenedentes bacterium]|nr:hypothetical protein [Candidatus Hydrogenedentota bacterium]